MNLLSLFRRPDKSPLNPRVLICALGTGFETLLSEDEGVYFRYFASVKIKTAEDATELLAEISNGYEIVHLFAGVTDDGIGTSNITGTELIEKAAKTGTKLLWVASGNEAEGYIKHFKPNGRKLNLVLTIDRRGPHFASFLRDLLGAMKAGSSMPVAWNRLAPQIPGREHPYIPATIFFCGLGQGRFI